MGLGQISVASLIVSAVALAAIGFPADRAPVTPLAQAAPGSPSIEELRAIGRRAAQQTPAAAAPTEAARPPAS